MTMMQSCCCWRSVRRGSFACAIYTVLYYSLIAVTIATVLQEESQYLAGNRKLPKSNSILEPEMSPITMRFNIALLICSSCGVVCCLLLLYGLFKDEKLFLLPWICTVIACSIVDISHLIYLFFFVSLSFNPITAMVLTLDFFLLCLNVYSVLCVVSQYQEYAAGRGTASDDCEHRVPAVRYTAQPTTTATSCLSSRRILLAANSGGGEAGRSGQQHNQAAAGTTPTQSPTTGGTVTQITSYERSPVSERTCSATTTVARKHVQFIPEARTTPQTSTTQSTTTTMNSEIRSDETFADQLKSWLSTAAHQHHHHHHHDQHPQQHQHQPSETTNHRTDAKVLFVGERNGLA